MVLKNDKGYGYNLVAIDIFSKSGWKVPLKKMHNKENFLSRTSLIFQNENQNYLKLMIEKKFLNKNFTEFSNENEIRRSGSCFPKVQFLLEDLLKLLENFSKDLVFEKLVQIGQLKTLKLQKDLLIKTFFN